MKPWWVYMLLCADGSLYTGITNDLLFREQAHNQGKGAKYTRSRLPVKMVYSEECRTRSAALKRELEIKSYRRVKKLSLLSDAVHLQYINCTMCNPN